MILKSHKSTWQEKPLHHDLSQGVIISNMSLVLQVDIYNNFYDIYNIYNLMLQGVDKTQSGIYTCVAHNSEGDGVSNPITLNVRCECRLQIV